MTSIRQTKSRFSSIIQWNKSGKKKGKIEPSQANKTGKKEKMTGRNERQDGEKEQVGQEQGREKMKRRTGRK